MDILPCVADSKFNSNMELYRSKSFSSIKLDNIAIRITDNKAPNYDNSTLIIDWLKSNPDGYAMWFADRCKYYTEKEKILLIPLCQLVSISKQICFAENCTDSQKAS